MQSISIAKEIVKVGPAVKAESFAIPKHIGIIMDGNRRWAKSKCLPSFKGHEEGAENIERIVEHASNSGVKMLTFYTLSTENLKSRTKSELKHLFRILIVFLKLKFRTMKKNGVALEFLGELKKLPLNVRKAARIAKEKLKHNTRIKVNIALNYGGRDEIIHAVKNLLKEGVSPKEVNEELISKNLYTNGAPDPELIIRTGGKTRLSNFLVWQCTYSELYFTDVFWPDFTGEEFDKALLYYADTQRNFGK